MQINLIIIKDYKEFTAEIMVDEMKIETIIAKEVEAVIGTEEGTDFSIGFSVSQNNELFDLENPRDIVRQFILKTFVGASINDASSE